MKFHLSAAIPALLCIPAAPAIAQEAPAQVQLEQVTMRLAARGPDAAGVVRGALVIDLEPGWKTYWIDPGEAGLQPQLDFSHSLNLAAPTLSFPVPHLVDDGFSTSLVLTGQVAIAFAATALPDAGPDAAAPLVRLDALVGVCETICIPVSVQLSRDLAKPAGLGEIAAIEAAFEALPDEAAEPADAFVADDRLTLPLPRADLADVAVFIAPPQGWEFGPAKVETLPGGNAVAHMPVLARPAGASGAAPADILLSAGEFTRFWRQTPIDIR